MKVFVVVVGRVVLRVIIICFGLIFFDVFCKFVSCLIVVFFVDFLEKIGCSNWFKDGREGRDGSKVMLGVRLVILICCGKKVLWMKWWCKVVVVEGWLLWRFVVKVRKFVLDFNLMVVSKKYLNLSFYM